MVFIRHGRHMQFPVPHFVSLILSSPPPPRQNVGKCNGHHGSHDESPRNDGLLGTTLPHCLHEEMPPFPSASLAPEPIAGIPAPSMITGVAAARGRDLDG